MGIEITKDESEKKREEVREKRKQARKSGDFSAAVRFDPTVLNDPDPNYRYKFVNVRTERVARHQAAGYEIIPAEDPASPIVRQATQTKTGGKEYGDMVLMRTPRENYEQRRAKARRKNELWQRKGIDQARERMEKIARDGRLSEAHKSATFDDSKEGEPFTVKR